jgi:hypothetical protein
VLAIADEVIDRNFRNGPVEGGEVTRGHQGRFERVPGHFRFDPDFRRIAVSQQTTFRAKALNCCRDGEAGRLISVAAEIIHIPEKCEPFCSVPRANKSYCSANHDPVKEEQQ